MVSQYDGINNCITPRQITQIYHAYHFFDTLEQGLPGLYTKVRSG